MAVKAVVKATWMSLHKRLISKFSLYLGCGLLVGLATEQIYHAEFPRKSIVMNEHLIGLPMNGDYFGILINRTRNRICDVHSTQVIFTKAIVKGKETDVVLPLEDTGLFWPKLGRATLLRLVPKPTNLPFPGPWYTMSVSTDDCHLWDLIFGHPVRESEPVAIIPGPAP
jgi:hypothetical protein